MYMVPWWPKNRTLKKAKKTTKETTPLESLEVESNAGREVRIFAKVKPIIAAEYNAHSGKLPSATEASCCCFSALLAAYGLGMGGGFFLGVGVGRGVR